MGKILSQLVNTGTEGQPEHIAFQMLDTLKIVELIDISHVMQDDKLRNARMPDDMQYVLTHMNHRCYIELTNFGENILYLD